jgi:coiled-coil domain-containing protein 77
MLFEERQANLYLTRENDLLKIKEMEDRKKIQELLLMTDSVDEQVILQKDIRPDVSVRYHNKENKPNSAN